MKLQFLGQGYEPESEYAVGKQLMKFLSDTDFHAFTGISAFASQSGVQGLSPFIIDAKHLNNIVIIVGVDQKATSKEALEALLALEIDAFVFYQPSYTIFHPKIYLFEGKEKSELIIGSSNLTTQGLFSNVEASILISVDNEVDRDIIEQVKTYFKGLLDFSDPNLKRLTQELIDFLVEQNIVPTEVQRKESQDKEDKTLEDDFEKTISTIFPKRILAKIPPEFRRKRKPRTASNIPVEISKEPVKNNDLELLWISKPLTERDLNVPKGGNTNPTGSMLFKKGALEGIDQRHYFREVVFADLDWTHDLRPESTHIERTTALFKFIIKGEDCGEFALTLSHNTKTDTMAYLQKNSMKQISWGKAKHIIAKKELIGKICKLYCVKSDFDRFVFEIA